MDVKMLSPEPAAWLLSAFFAFAPRRVRGSFPLSRLLPSALASSSLLLGLADLIQKLDFELPLMLIRVLRVHQEAKL
jgi:hypothetical protein